MLCPERIADGVHPARALSAEPAPPNRRMVVYHTEIGFSQVYNSFQINDFTTTFDTGFVVAAK